MSDGSVNQFQIPGVAVFGEPAERTLPVGEFEAWARLRQDRCGHPQLLPSCKWCLGTLDVCEAMGGGSDHIQLFPMGH